MEQEIRDRNNSLIGRITVESNGDKTVRDKYNKLLGYYRKSSDTTYDKDNRVVARGDASAMLLSK